MVPELPVIVVGAGPTGLLAALLLAREGLPVLVLDRYAEPWPLPRAVHADDEVARLLAGAGVAFGAVSRPTLGLQLLDARHRVLAQFDRSPGGGRHGWPQANLFDQPELEAQLRAALARQPTARLRAPAEVVRVETGEAPRVHLAGGQVLAAVAVLGCDGAGSAVARDVGGGQDDLGFSQPWLVVDGRCAEPLDTWDGVQQVCDPHRAATYLRVGADRYRWEFALRPGERPDDLPLEDLLRPWTGGASVEVLRSASYVFRARLTRRWRAGRVLLLGDAAHLTPPFVGQGLGAGLRDAANLTWKLARVLRGQAPEQLLDTYAAERRPHVRSSIRQARTAGRLMTGGGAGAALLRGAVLPALAVLPGAAARVLDPGSPALSGPLGRRRGRPRPGTLAPQPRVSAGGQLLDEVLGPGFAVLTRVPPDPELRALARRLPARLLRVRGPGPLASWLGADSAVVLRPDRTVLAAGRSGAALVRAHAAALALVGVSPARARPAPRAPR